MNKEVKYFNFPVQLLNDFLVNPQKCLSDIARYSVYAHSLKMTNAKELDRFTTGAAYYNIQFHNIKMALNDGKVLYDSISSKSPMTGINTKIYWDFYSNEKTEYDKMCLLGFLALKSIVQKKAYCKTNNQLWLARMSGKIKWDSAESLPECMMKYVKTRDAILYHTSKIKTDLEINWGLVSYSHRTRGFFISFKMSRKDLAFQAENKKHSNKVKRLKEQNKQAREDALLRIKNDTTNALP